MNDFAYPCPVEGDALYFRVGVVSWTSLAIRDTHNYACGISEQDVNNYLHDSSLQVLTDVRALYGNLDHLLRRASNSMRAYIASPCTALRPWAEDESVAL